MIKSSNIHNNNNNQTSNTTRIGFKSNRKDWSTYHLYTLRKSIDDKLNNNNVIKQELKMQKEISQKVLCHIKTSMLSTQQSGIDIVNRFEQQKCKNDYLSRLVRHYEELIQKAKVKQYQNLMNNIQTNEYDELRILIRQKERILQIITNKLNSSQCQKMQKYELVKGQRRQRIVFSNQFNTFQTQIFDLQYKYKQFVIERTILQKIFQNKTQQFKHIHNQYNKHMHHLQSNKHQNKNISHNNNNNYQNNQNHLHSNSKIHINHYNNQHKQHYSSFNYQLSFNNQLSPNNQLSFNNKSTHNSLFNNSLFSDHNLLIQPSFYRTKSKLNHIKIQKSQLTSKNQINLKKISNLQYLKKIQSILNDFSLHSIKQLKHVINEGKNNTNIKIEQQQKQQCLNKINRINQHKGIQIQNIQNEIDKWNEKINELKKIKKHKNMPIQILKQKQFKINQHKQLKQLIDKFKQQIKRQNQLINQFNSSQNLQLLKKLLNIQVNQQSSQNIHQPNNQIINIKLMQSIQHKLVSIMGNLADSKLKQRQPNIRKSLFFQSCAFTQQKQRDSSLIMTQRTICPLLEPSRVHNFKRMKTAGSQQLNHQGIKKLSNLLKNQSRLKGPTDIATKDQMIREATQVFDKEGIFRQQRFQVRYS